MSLKVLDSFQRLMKIMLLNILIGGSGFSSSVLPSLIIKAKKINASFGVSQNFYEDFEKNQYGEVVDILDQELGSYLVQTGGSGKSAYLFLRGSNPEHTLVLIDGMTVHDPSSPNGGFDFGQIEAESFHKVEIFRGPYAASQGSGAIGGVVHLTTQKGEGNFQGTLLTEAGSSKNYRQQGSFKGEKGQLDYYVHASHYQMDNPSSVPLNKRSIPRQIHPDPYDRQSFVSNLGINGNKGWRFNVCNRHQRSRSRYSNEFSSNPYAQDKIIHDFHVLSLEGQIKEYGWYPKVQIGFLQNDRTYGNEIAPFNGTSFYRGQGINIQCLNQFIIKSGYVLHAGIDHHLYSYKSSVPNFGSSFSFHNNASAHESSFVLGKQVTPHERVDLEVWGRCHHSSHLSSRFIYRGSMTYHHFETKTDLFVHYGTVIHNPSLFQLFDPESGNGSIRPEKGYGRELGVHQGLKDVTGFNMNMETRFFQTFLKDLIVGQQLSPLVYQYVNIERTKTQGLESFINWTISKTIQLNLGHTYTRAKNLITQETLLRRPLHKIMIKIQWDPFSAMRLTFSLSHEGRQLDQMRFPPYTKVYTKGCILGRGTVNYTLPYRGFKGTKIDLFARMENMFNQSYQKPAGYLQPGVSLYTGVKIVL